MSKLSIRKLPLDLDKAIRREVQKRHTTKTQVVIDALKEAFQVQKNPTKVRRNIRDFFGKMTRQEYKRFKKVTEDFSKIDEDMWK